MTAVLTPEQREVLLLVAHGFSNDEIAELLQVKRSIVGRRMYAIRAALGARSRSHAVWIGATEGHLRAPVQQPPALDVPGPEVGFQPEVVA